MFNKIQPNKFGNKFKSRTLNTEQTNHLGYNSIGDWQGYCWKINLQLECQIEKSEHPTVSPDDKQDLNPHSNEKSKCLAILRIINKKWDETK